jgi:hypothetical protein
MKTWLFSDKDVDNASFVTECTSNKYRMNPGDKVLRSNPRSGLVQAEAFIDSLNLNGKGIVVLLAGRKRVSPYPVPIRPFCPITLVG